MPDIQPPISRRSMLACTSAVPLAAVFGPRESDLTAQCAAWLAASFEIDRLSLRWSLLETFAVRNFDWFNLSAAERLRVPLATEMAEIETRLAVLDDSGVRSLEALAGHPAQTVHEVASKLAVAARMLEGEGGPVHLIVAEAVSVIAGLR